MNFDRVIATILFIVALGVIISIGYLDRHADKQAEKIALQQVAIDSLQIELEQCTLKNLVK